MPIVMMAIPPMVMGFQSTPAIASGRCLRRQAGEADQGRGFNPRPPLLAGDAWARRKSGRVSTCFNPRPPLLAGDALWPNITHASKQFQSTPAIASGRCARSIRQACCLQLFQSTPAIASGRCRCPAAAGAGASPFQSTPAIASGRCRCPAAAGAGASPFQSTPAIASGRCTGKAGHGGRHRVSIHARHC